MSIPTPNIDSLILERLKEQLETLTWVKQVEYEDIITVFDSEDFRTPYIQVFGNGQNITHERNGRVKVRWSVIVELVLKEKRTGVVNQADLLNKRQEVEQAIGANVKLGIDEVINVLYLSNLDDIGLVKPYYVTQLELSVEYYKPYAGFC